MAKHDKIDTANEQPNLVDSDMAPGIRKTSRIYAGKYAEN